MLVGKAISSAILLGTGLSGATSIFGGSKQVMGGDIDLSRPLRSDRQPEAVSAPGSRTGAASEPGRLTGSIIPNRVNPNPDQDVLPEFTRSYADSPHPSSEQLVPDLGKMANMYANDKKEFDDTYLARANDLQEKSAK